MKRTIADYYKSKTTEQREEEAGSEREKRGDDTDTDGNAAGTSRDTEQVKKNGTTFSHNG